MTNIHLCSIPFLSTSYTNVIDFENADSRELWFTSKTLRTVKTNFKYDNNSIVVFLQSSPHTLEMHTEILTNYIITVKAG